MIGKEEKKGQVTDEMLNQDVVAVNKGEKELSDKEEKKKLALEAKQKRKAEKLQKKQ